MKVDRGLSPCGEYPLPPSPPWGRDPGPNMVGLPVGVPRISENEGLGGEPYSHPSPKLRLWGGVRAGLGQRGLVGTWRAAIGCSVTVGR